KRPRERQITWTAHRTHIDFTFTGGIIVVANKSLQHVPELAALATRIPVVQLTVTFEEVAALMRDVARLGYQYGTDYIGPVQALEVVKWLIDRMRSQNLALDMRLMIGGFHDYLHWRSGQTGTHWEDLLESRIKRQTTPYKTRAERIAEEKVVAEEIMAMK